ncbi:MAG: hypothetical protein K2X00_02800 [Nitrospiraceae bacterium]|nr:hypothetical protein [Nitrospiraceae bacterium]
MLQYAFMALETPPGATPYRVTLFFGPEPVDDGSTTQTCVFNVKKRSWKAGIQVSVDIAADHLAGLQEAMRRTAPVARALERLSEEDRTDAAARIPDLAAQAIAWCKLDLRLAIGLPQENQRIPAEELVAELNQAVTTRQEYVVTYILTELDLMP